ncbi:alpha/beta fold hydrolase [Nocardioides marmoribigeumensis]|uniref:Pimeloyl-ACP methyl ester carboxylesterase n=1 Tax=Nocardioides marmoribigeumensis TaxID=433649 RepID=A0ABU2BWJ4_9ACTN|nr:alpha/beta fold hydrolase [Nocardioides marmoribigeumensis]MDR7362504.1 pimeloyl-ACP methyl ester carboxylesterase [Nocardioides marmoribigeumensis]
MPTPDAPPLGEDRITSFTRAGLTFDVRDTGPLEGDVVVLLHGFPQRAASWDQVAAHLHAAGFRTIAPDQRGYSPGARPIRRRDYALPLLADDAAALLDAIGRPVHLVGHDWGAAVAWLVAGSHPAVRSLTSVSVPHPAAYLRAVAGPQLLKSWYVLLFMLPRVTELMATRAPARFVAQLLAFGMTDQEADGVLRDVVAYGALPGGLGWYRAIPLTGRRTRAMWQQKVSVPVTHVWSTGDTALGRSTAELAERWTTGPFELVVLEGLSHWLPEQAPDVLAEVVLSRIEG